VRNSYDIVPHLDATDDPDRTDRSTVTFNVQNGGIDAFPDRITYGNVASSMRLSNSSVCMSSWPSVPHAVPAGASSPQLPAEVPVHRTRSSSRTARPPSRSNVVNERRGRTS
jgi:hypothetical protein